MLLPDRSRAVLAGRIYERASLVERIAGSLRIAVIQGNDRVGEPCMQPSIVIRADSTAGNAT